jgi:hypothetical protein
MKLANEESTCRLGETWKWPVKIRVPLTVHTTPIMSESVRD